MSKDELLADIRRKMSESAKRKLACMLCKDPADARGVFIPNEGFSRKIGMHAAVYPICSACAKKPGSPDLVEEVLTRQTSHERN